MSVNKSSHVHVIHVIRGHLKFQIITIALVAIRTCKHRVFDHRWREVVGRRAGSRWRRRLVAHWHFA